MKLLMYQADAYVIWHKYRNRDMGELDYDAGVTVDDLNNLNKLFNLDYPKLVKGGVIKKDTNVYNESHILFGHDIAERRDTLGFIPLVNRLNRLVHHDLPHVYTYQKVYAINKALTKYDNELEAEVSGKK